MQRLETIAKAARPEGIEVIVMGGMVVDIVGKTDSSEQESMYTSRGGEVWVKPGGVGRNIVEGIGRLGVKCGMVSSVGADDRGEDLDRRLKAAGVDTTNVHKIKNMNTATYQCILAKDGGLITAVADMAIFETITPSLVPAFPRSLKVLCLDGNLPVSTLHHSLASVPKNVVVVFEPTSVPKSTKILPDLSLVDIITPNDLELSEIYKGLCGPSTAPSLRESAEYVLSKTDLLAVVVTLGKDGVACYTSPRPLGNPCKSQKWASFRLTSSVFTVPAVPVSDIIDVTGAGDSLTAGLIAGLTRGLGMKESLVLGTHAARSTLQSKLSVSETMRKDCEGI